MSFYNSAEKCREGLIECKRQFDKPFEFSFMKNTIGPYFSYSTGW